MDTPATASAPTVLLLSLWRGADLSWHARLVDSEARVHDFDSPFELARHLYAPAPQPRPPDAAPDPAGGAGLR